MLPHHKLVSLDITNRYTNIPVKETKMILTKILTHSPTTPQTQQELFSWYDVITKLPHT